MQRPDDKREEAEFDLRQYWSLALQYKWVIAGAVVLSTAAVLLWSIRQPRLYEATLTIEYDPNPVRPLGKEIEEVGDPVSNFWSSREFFNTQNKILSSRTMAERVVDELDLHQDPRFFNASGSDFEPRTITDTARALQASLVVEPEPETRIVALKVQGYSPELTAAIANTWAELYIQKTLEDRNASTITALEWLGNQMEKLRTELDESELALHKFKKEHGVLSVSMEDRQNLVAKDIAAYNEALTEAKKKRIELSARVARLEKLRDANPETIEASVIGDTVALGIRSELLKRIAERNRLSETYGPAHPKMQEVDREITALRKQLSESIGSIIDSAKADLREAQRIESGIDSAMNEAHSAGFDLNLREIEYQKLNRQRMNKAALYEHVLQRSTEAGLTRQFKTSFVRILDRALEPRFPVSPNITANTLGGIGAGLLLGLGIAFLLSRMDRRIASVEEVEALGLPVLGIMPIVTQSGPVYGRYTTKLRSASKPPPGQSPISADRVVATHPMSSAAESCRMIRTNLTFMGVERPLRTLVVTSSGPREGKTTIATNLAISLAQSGKRVLLIDTDLRRPRVHKAMAIENAELGATSVMSGSVALQDALVRSEQTPGLCILPCGPIPETPSELLHQAGFRALLSQAADDFDVVLLDSPPLGAVTDAAIIAPQVDGVIVVVNSNRTTRESLRGALRQLRDVSANVAGGVLNNVDIHSNRYGSYQYYYRRDGYYSEADTQDRPLAAE